MKQPNKQRYLGGWILKSAALTAGWLMSSVLTGVKAQITPAATLPKNNQYLESARLVIDILQLFKKSSTEKSSWKSNGKQVVCNYCLYNSDSVLKIKVSLVPKNRNNPDTITLVIAPGSKECSLQIACGIYNCKIATIDDRIISWGDVWIDEREVKLSKQP